MLGPGAGRLDTSPSSPPHPPCGRVEFHSARIPDARSVDRRCHVPIHVRSCLFLLGPINRSYGAAVASPSAPMVPCFVGSSLTVKQGNMMLFDVIFSGSLSGKQCWWVEVRLNSLGGFTMRDPCQESGLSLRGAGHTQVASPLPPPIPGGLDCSISAVSGPRQSLCPRETA